MLALFRLSIVTLSIMNSFLMAVIKNNPGGDDLTPILAVTTERIPVPHSGLKAQRRILVAIDQAVSY